MAWSDGVMECWAEDIYLRLSDESRIAPMPGWVVWVCLAGVADRRKDDSNFTIHHRAIVAWFRKKRLRTVRTIFSSKIGVSTPPKPL
jgi:hypothetical protein